MAPPNTTGTPSSADSQDSDSASLASVTDQGALMLPEPAAPKSLPEPAAPPARLPALPLGAESLVAARLRNSKREADMLDGGDVQAVPARLTPRGSLVALAEMPEEAAQVAVARVTPPADNPVVAAARVALGEGQNNENPFRIRAEVAEQQARKLRMDNKKLEGEIRKLRADAYFQRIGKNVQGPRSAGAGKSQEGELPASDADTAADIAARLLAEERAVKAETELLHLHTELQAARIQFAILSDNNGVTTLPPPESSKGPELPEYKVLPCFRYICGCLRFFILQLFVALCICSRGGASRLHEKIDEKNETPDNSPVKTFCVADRA